MPTYYNMPSVFGNATVEDTTKFAQLPFYLVKNEIKAFQRNNIFDQLFGKIPWVENQGDTMKGVTPQRSPVGQAFFFPNQIATLAKKDVYTVTESAEVAQIKAHKFESFQFNFLPSFQVFWDTYLQFQNKDLAEKIAVRNNQFIETNMWFNATNVYLAGTGLISGCPTGMGNDAGNAPGSKTSNWLLSLVQGTGGNAGVQQNLTLRDLNNAVVNLQEDLRAPSFSGVYNMGKDNEGIKEKYVLVTSGEQWLGMPYDPDVLNKLSGLAPCDFNTLFNDFRGSLFGTITTKINPYPIRFSGSDIKDGAGNVLWAAGTPIDAEVYNSTNKKWEPNPFYTSLISAPYEISWLLGADYCKTIKVGPPPKEFASQSMSGQKFYKMQWNGEVRLTDQVLITNTDGSVELNTYGEQLKFQSKLTFGYLVGERRNAFPIISRRTRPAKLV